MHQVTVKGKTSIDPQITYSDIDASYSVMGKSQKMKTESYVAVDGDKSESYINMDDEWQYSSTDMSQYSGMIDEIKDQVQNFDYSKINDFVDKITTTQDGDQYKIVAEVSLKNIYKKIQDTGLADELGGIDEDTIPDIDFVITLTADAKTYLPSSLDIKLNSDSFDIEGVKAKIDEFSFTTNIVKYGDVEVTIPEEVLAAKDN